MPRGRPKKAPVRKRNRQKLDGGRFKLTTPQIPGFALRWVNDVKDRLLQFTTHDDWEHVMKHEISPDGTPEVGDPNVTPGLQVGEKVARVVGFGDGKPVYAYLMKKRQDYYDDDQAEKEEEIAEVEKQLQQSRNAPIDNQYGDGVKIQRG